jgi:hypothetical protein
MTSGALAKLTWILALTGLLLGDVREGKWDFEKDRVGAPPVGFYFRKMGDGPPGKWEVVNDGGNQVLAQLSESPERYRFPMAILAGSKTQNVKLQVRIKAIRGEKDQSGGVVWRYQDAENYMLARMDVTERNVRLFRIWDGNRIHMGEENGLDLKTNQWYTLRVEHRGPEIKVYLNDDIMLIRHTKHFHKAGRFGLWTKADSVMYFDDLVVEDLDADDDHEE